MKLAALFENNIINESFKDAKNAFASEADTATVDEYLNKFKELSSKNIINGPEKDINSWIRKGFNEFKNFVQKAAQIKSNKEMKREVKSGGATKVAEYPNWTVIMPLTKEASCQYGAGTQWCTASTKGENEFDRYFNGQQVNLYYIIAKSGNEKYAIACHRSDGEIEDIFDARDNHMDITDLARATGLNIEKEVQKWASAGKGSEPSMDATVENADAETAVSLLTSHGRKLSEEQIAALKAKIAKNADALIEYCHIFRKNDELYQKAPRIFLNNMSKDMNTFVRLVPFLEDYIDTMDERSPFIEKAFGEVVNKLDASMDRHAIRFAHKYAMKFSPNDTEALLHKMLP